MSKQKRVKRATGRKAMRAAIAQAQRDAEANIQRHGGVRIGNAIFDMSAPVEKLVEEQKAAEDD